MYADNRSIFGDTVNGVANPYVPHLHPYPTRYHGQDRTMIDTMPRLSAYRARPLAVRPHAGLGAEESLPGFTHSRVLDAAIGAAIGYFGAPRRDAAVVHAVLGGITVGATGHLGVMALLAVELFMNKQEQAWR